MMRFAIQLTLGYVLVDLIFVIGQWEVVGGWAYLVHHLIFPLTYGVGLYVLTPPFGLYCMLVLQVRGMACVFL